MSFYNDQIKNGMFITQAVVVTPADDADLPKPGVLFLDNSSTEGVVTVDLLNGGTVILDLKKGIYDAIIVRKVYEEGTTALGIFVNPISQ